MLMEETSKDFRRHVFQDGRRRKFLVVVDETPESESALAFAATRVQRTGGVISMLYVIRPGQYQQWLGVQARAREEAEQKARAVFRLDQRKLHNWGFDVEVEEIIREGNAANAIKDVIEKDHDIAILVLGASTDQAGPGPLISQLMSGGMAGHFPVPISIIPGTLAPDEIESMA